MTPDKAKEPRAPTAGRMKKPPVSRGPARELGCCRGTYPPPAAGCMVTAFAPYQKRAPVFCRCSTSTVYHRSLVAFYGQFIHRAVMQPQDPAQIPVNVRRDPLPPLAKD